MNYPDLFRKHKSKTLVALSILALVCLLAFLFRGEEAKYRELNILSSGKVQADANVAFRGVAIIIRNDNHFDWTNTQITLMCSNKLYHVQAGRMSKGETRGFIMSDFVTNEGEPYNYKNTKIEAVSILSNEAEGQVQVTRPIYLPAKRSLFSAILQAFYT